jgi:thiamine-phosphate pyrophosphorylase
MILCLVTDRRRLASALGARPHEAEDALALQVGAAVKAGIDLVQVREPDLETADLIRLVRRLLPGFETSSAKLLVNDRLDVALAAKASGVHLKEGSFRVSDVRRIAPEGFRVGCSVHSRGAALTCREADFLVAGTVLPTSSKPGAPTIGWDGLQSIVEVAAPTPVLAIGGVDKATLAQVAKSGAAGFAAIGAFIPGATDGQVTEFLQKRLAELRKTFDSAHSVP